MNGYQSLSHSRWDCKYHVVFVPKGRKKSLYGKIREFLKKVFHELARQKGCQIVEGYMSGDHVHMCISIPPKYAVSEVIGYLKGKNAIAVARQFAGRQKNFNDEHFGSRGYSVPTVGFEENKI
jgi:putative transposase